MLMPLRHCHYAISATLRHSPLLIFFAMLFAMPLRHSPLLMPPHYAIAAYAFAAAMPYIIFLRTMHASRQACSRAQLAMPLLLFRCHY